MTMTTNTPLPKTLKTISAMQDPSRVGSPGHPDPRTIDGSANQSQTTGKIDPTTESPTGGFEEVDEAGNPVHANVTGRSVFADAPADPADNL